MHKSFLLIYLTILSLFTSLASGENLRSPYNAKSLFNLAHEIHTWPGAGADDRLEAMIMLNAVYELDSQANYVFDEIIDLAVKSYKRDYSDAVLFSLRKYLRSDSDLIPAIKASKYLLSHQNSREEREAVLNLLMNQVGARNDIFFSEMATEMGFLYVEKADFKTALRFFNAAYSRNPYNNLAFRKILELSDGQVNEIAVAAHHRFMLANNPLSLEAAMSYANYAYSLGLYTESYQGWKYYVELFKYLNPDSELPKQIYVPWSISALRADNLTRCLQIATRYRQEHGFNILIEVIAAKAARKMGDSQLANKILNEAQEQALEMQEDGQFSPGMLAWFYSFGKEMPENALAWANKAYSQDPNSPEIETLFGYAMVLNEEYDLAAEQLKDVEDNQIKLLAQARIDMAKDNRQEAVEKLKEMIEIQPGSIEAQAALDMLEQQNSAYIPKNSPSSIRKEFGKIFGNRAVEFVKPDNMLNVSIKTNGNEFSYDHDIQTELIITNTSKSQIVVNQTSIFKGNILISAKIKGDIKATIPELLKIETWPSKPIEPGKSLIIPVTIVTGPLREIMLSYPQAGFNIELTAYIDPVKDKRGNYSNYIKKLKPVTTTIKRNPVILSNRYLQSRLEALNAGQQGQVISSVRLFTGLLAEQAAFERLENPPYRLLFVETELLKSAVQKALRDENWTVKFQTMIAMQFVPLDHELVSTLGELIQDQNWPVRLMALNLLANSQGRQFDNVLDWTAKNDSNTLVRQMAVALGGQDPEQEPENAENSK